MAIQSIVFDNRYWSIPMAVKWLKDHGYKATKVDTKFRTYRFRQLNPNLFTKFRTKSTTQGITFIIGF